MKHLFNKYFLIFSFVFFAGCKEKDSPISIQTESTIETNSQEYLMQSSNSDSLQIIIAGTIINTGKNPIKVIPHVQFFLNDVFFINPPALEITGAVGVGNYYEPQYGISKIIDTLQPNMPYLHCTKGLKISSDYRDNVSWLITFEILNY
jgi:hypothetical protein